MKNKTLFAVLNSGKILVAASLLLLAGAVAATAGNASLTVSDAGGDSSLTNNTGHNWSITGAPSAANDYYSSNFFIRTPLGVVNPTFAGNSLTLQPPNGQATPMRSILFKGAGGQIITINNLTNAGGVINCGSGNVLAIFTGNQMTVISNSTIQADQGPITVGYTNIYGSGDITNTGTSGNTGKNITYTGNLSGFTGRLVVPAAFPDILVLNGPNAAPGNPATPTPSQIDLGAGTTLLDSYGVSLVNANGGITLEGNATINTSGTNGPTIISEPITDNGGGYNLISRGGGVVTLSGNNTFSGGLTRYGVTVGGQLNINSANAIGTGMFTINNGNNASLDNTSGSDLILANNNAQTWANSFVFIGTKSLNMGSGFVTMSGSLTVTVSNNNLTVGAVTDLGSGYALTKAGAGALTLSDGGAYSGATTVSGGTLVVQSSSLSSSTFNVASNAVLDLSAVGGLNLPGSGILAGSGTVNGQVTDNSATGIFPGGGLTAGTLTVNGDLTLNGGGGLTFDLTGNTTPGGGTNDLIVVTGALNLAGATTTITIAGIPVSGTYTLIQYGSFSGSLANLSVPTGYTLNNNTIAKTIELVVTHVPASITWVGDGGANIWDAGTTPNWKQGATPGLDFFTGDTVTFDDSGSASSPINLTGSITPLTTTVNTVANTYDFQGTGILNGSLTKSGSGTLILENSNSYAGPTVINGGTVQLGNGGTTGSLGNGPVTNNGAIVVNGNTTANFPGAISGTGSLTLQAGSATLVASNSYTGATTVSSGTLYVVNGSSLGATNGGTTVASGGKLYITANVNIGPEALSLAGDGALQKGAGGVTTYDGPITLTADSGISIDGGATLNLSNTVSGAAALAAQGSASGTLSLNTTNNFTGGFTLNGPIVNVTANGALGAGPITVSGSGRLVLATGLTLTNGVTASTVNPGVATGLLMVGDNTNGTVTTVSGPLSFSSVPASGGNFLGPNTSGYLLISGLVSFPGGTVSSRNGFVRFSGGGDYASFGINQGTASLGANNGLSTNASLVLAQSGAAAFDLNGFNQALTGLSAIGANATVTNSTSSLSTLTLNLPSNIFPYAGVIGGKLDLVQISGFLQLTATNTYTGNTTVDGGGVLELGQPGLAVNSTVTLTNGATLQLDFAVTNQIAGLVLEGVAQPLGVYNNSTSPSFITGSGSLLVGLAGPSGPAQLTNSVSGNTLSLSWPAGQGWKLQMQTNTLATGLGANWVYVTDASVSSTNVTITAGVPTVFYRLVYP